MFCYQCEQTAFGTGCTKRGVCGKSPETSDLQDLLVEITAGVGCYASRLAALGIDDMEAGRFAVQALFTTVTNVNFTADSIAEWIFRGALLRNNLAGKYRHALSGLVDTKPLPAAATFMPAADIIGMEQQSLTFGIEARRMRLGEDKAGVFYMIVYGLKGASAYADHAYRLGKEDPGLYRLFHETLAFIADEPQDMNMLLDRALRVGELNLRAMELLDEANTEAYGHPEPTNVRITPKRGKCILVSGHDLRDLRDVLEATAGTGVNVYTHGEMLPANAYPGLKKYPNLAGNYGGAWQNQEKEFADFPGPILLTTNCLIPPKSTYAARVYTTGMVSCPGIKHLENGLFRPLVDDALRQPGFTADEPEKSITIGYARNAISSVADQIIAAVKSGAIRHFYLVGGCDGAKPGRNYYTEFVETAPPDTVILTLACGKFRFNKLPLGDIGGIPRLLDLGQCNDAYSAIQVALALAKSFDCGVNELPLSLIISWYEQKAVAVLLTLLHLGIRNIHLGPTLPAFATPAVLATLGEKFGLTPITTPERDLEETLAVTAGVS